MKQVIHMIERINKVALSDTLQAALGDNFIGYSTRRGEVVIHLTDQTTNEQVAQVRQILQTHDPTQLTPDQQDNRARQERLQQVRRQNQALLDLLQFEDQPRVIKLLARKIYWLEQEVRLLRRDQQSS